MSHRLFDDHVYLSGEDLAAIYAQPDASAWQPSVCPMCAGPCESRVVGLQSVALTGDETAASTERRSVGVDPNDEAALMAALASLRSRKP